MSRIWKVATGLAVLALAGATSALAAERAMSAAGLRDAAAGIAVGEKVRIDGFGAGEANRNEVFVGERFEVFSPDARIVVAEETGERELPVPYNVYFKGRFEGIAGSRVLITVLENGTVRGVATEPGGASLILPSGSNGVAEIRWVDPGVRAPSFRCDQSLLAGVETGAARGIEPLVFESRQVPEGPTPAHTSRVAIETDFEFYQLFNDTPAAISYAADLIAYMSIMYEAEVNTSMYMSYIKIRPTAADPWTEFSTICNLFQFGRYWNNNMAGESRSIAHMMSGKNNGGGVAWTPALCAGPFSTDSTPYGCSFTGVQNFGGDYGYTGDMDGNFVYENPGVLWDIVATSHEIGHNFDSPHTHCYNGIGGNANPVDGCYNGECAGGCYCGANMLPGTGSLSGGTPGAGNGTVMSYCHLLSGGMSNITYTLGTGHPFGIAPGRVPIRMAARVAAVAGSGCVDFVPGSSVIFRDGVDNNSTSNWSSVIP